MEAPSTPSLKPTPKEISTEKVETINTNVIISPLSKHHPSIIQTNIKSVSNPVATTSAASTSKVFIITPEQIAKLGLTQQLNKVVESQMKPVNKTPNEGQEKKGVRISKITIINSSLAENSRTVTNKSESIRSETLMKTTGAKHEVTTGMKNKLLNLLKSRTAPTTTTTVISSNSPNERKTPEQHIESYDLIRKRKLESLEGPSQKMAKTLENDVIDLDADIPTTKVNVPVSKPKFTILNLTRPIVTSTSVIQSVGNTISIQEQPNIIKNVVPSEEPKQKIQVLSNQQISLSSDCIRLLKGHTSDKPQNKPLPTILNYKAAESNEIMNVSLDEPIIIEDDTEKPTNETPVTVPSSVTNEQKSDEPNVENLQMQFVDKDMILLINNTEFNFVEYDKEKNPSNSATCKETDTSESSKTSSNDTNLPVIDLTDETRQTNSTNINPVNRQLPNIIQTRIVSIEKPDQEKKDSKSSNQNDTDETHQTNNTNINPVNRQPPNIIQTRILSIEKPDQEKKDSRSSNQNDVVSSEVIDISGDDSLTDLKNRPNIIQSFTEKIRNKLHLDANTIKTSLNTKPNCKIIRTYSKINSVLMQPPMVSSVKMSEDLKPTSSTIISIKPSAKQQKPPEKQVYKKRKSLLIDLSETQDKEVSDKRNSVIIKNLLGDQSKLTNKNSEKNNNKNDDLANSSSSKNQSKQNNLDSNMDSIIIDDNDDSETNEQDEIPKPTLKKRGRKKKSEMLKIQELEAQRIESEPQPALELSKRGRKRKVVNYCALAEGSEIDDIYSSARKPRMSQSEGTYQKNDVSINSESEELAPKPKKRGRPKKVRTEDTSVSEDKDKTIDTFNDNENKETLPESENAEDDVEVTSIHSESEEVTPKPKKRGRPKKVRTEDTSVNEDKDKTIDTVNDSGNKETLPESENAEDNVKDTSIDSESEEVTPKPKKRGRPKKVRTGDISVNEDKDKTIDTLNNIENEETLPESENAEDDVKGTSIHSQSEEEEPILKPKRHERPKQIETEETSDEEDKDDNKNREIDDSEDKNSETVGENKNSEKSTETSIKSEEQLQTPRKRGRPRKITIEDKDEDKNISNDENRKLENKTLETLTEPLSACEKDSTVLAEQSPKPKQRGRPRKITTEYPLSTEDKDQDKTTETINHDQNKELETVEDIENKNSEILTDNESNNLKAENLSESQNACKEDDTNSVLEEQTQKPKRSRKPKKITTEGEASTGKDEDENKKLDTLEDIKNKNSEILSESQDTCKKGDTNSVSEEQIQKPQRGRKSKNMTTEDASTSKDEEGNKNTETQVDDEYKRSEIFSESVSEGETPKPRKRGRARTIEDPLPSETTIDENKNSETLNDVESNQTIEESNIDNEDKGSPSQVNESRNDSTEEIKPKRVRGRPRRSKHTTTMLDTLVGYISTPPPVQKQIKQENAATDVAKSKHDPDASLDQTGAENQGNGSLVIQKSGKRGRKGRKSESTVSDVTCAVCNQQMAKTAWLCHKLRFHNNLAWRTGDPPLDLHDERLVINILTDIYKKKKPLYCNVCGTTKKSVMGFLSHKGVCQKSTEEITAMRVKCEYCDRTMMPVSVTMHLKFCKKANADNTSIDGESSFKATNDDLLVEGKRKAATKAKDLIKSFNEDDTVEKPKIKKPRYSRMWIQNYDFRPNYFGRRRFASEINKNGDVKCRFEECEFKSSDLNEFLNHLHKCEKKPKEGYTCKYCIITYKTEDEVMEHLKELHSTHTKDLSDNDEPVGDDDDDDEDEYGDREDNKQLVKNKFPLNKSSILHGIKFLLKNRHCSPSTNIIYPPALEWMMKFCKENYSIPNLFPNWRITLKNWESLDPLYLSNYLPQLKYSACTAEIQNKSFVDPLRLDHEWKRYKLFESHLSSTDTATFFCGGPVLAMAWLPTPYDQKNCEQILAVCANSHVNREYTLDEAYSESGLIQFWNCGTLINNTLITNPPKLEFCIAHDYGPVWCLEWCPSGCYDIQQTDDYLQRLGILAVGTVDSCVYLYSLCFPFKNRSKIVKPKPVAKLLLESIVENTANDLEAHVTRISWSKASQHRYLLVGYANGLVAIFDLNTTSPLLKTNNDGIETIMPYRVISAHDHAITALSLYHLNDGRRWIMTGSIDRSIKYWDLENPAVPLTKFIRIIVTDGVWLSHWLSNVICFDDSCSGGLTASVAHQLRNYESSPTTVMYSGSSVLSVAGSEWLNGFVQSNVVGELKGFFPHQMFCTMDSDKTYKNKRAILGYTRLIPKALTIPERLENEKQILEQLNKKSQRIFEADQITDIQNTLLDCSKPEPSAYQEAEEKYGLVFCDISLGNIKDFPATIEDYYKSNKSHKLYITRPVGYPLQAINKVVLNPNRSSFSYLAAGYQAGFVRISSLSFIDKRPL